MCPFFFKKAGKEIKYDFQVVVAVRNFNIPNL